MRLTPPIFAISLLSLSASVLAEDARYASITHIYSSHINGGECVYAFLLDNGGNHMVLDNAGFGPLELTLRLKDKQGKVIGDEILEVEEFGEYGAIRSTLAYLGAECADVGAFQLVKAIENQNGKRIVLPLEIFDPMNPERAKMSVAGNP